MTHLKTSRNASKVVIGSGKGVVLESLGQNVPKTFRGENKYTSEKYLIHKLLRRQISIPDIIAGYCAMQTLGL
ncbi:hypothetical protein RDI58_023492 [Solanum bulbocastanum]|uniref:Uncharacterized protein n=1 Tax=Solanum bulbocastanum TaxID=147425 RepID=A0AAN8T3W1_SOLBU